MGDGLLARGMWHAGCCALRVLGCARSAPGTYRADTTNHINGIVELWRMWTTIGEAANRLGSVCTARHPDTGMFHAALEPVLFVIVGCGVWGYERTRRWYRARTLKRRVGTGPPLHE
jgi:hypothetical protein